MALMNLPHLIFEILPICMLIACLILCGKLAKNNEILVIFTSGISIWKFIQPFIITSFILSAIGVTILQPISAICQEYRKVTERDYSIKKGPALTFSNIGIFISEFIDDQNRIINAKSLDSQNNTLNSISVLIFNKDFQFIKRIVAEKAILDHGFISFLGNSYEIAPNGGTSPLHEGNLSTNMSMDIIVKRFESPETVSFWQLGNVASDLESSGIRATKFINYYFKLLFKPLYSVAIILISLCFLKVNPRNIIYTRVIAIGSIAGLITYAFTEISVVLLSQNDFGPSYANLIPTIILGTSAFLCLIQKYEG